MQRFHAHESGGGPLGQVFEEASTPSSDEVRLEAETETAGVDHQRQQHPQATTTPVPTAPTVETPLLGRYTLQERLAHDCLGTLYRAIDNETGNEVAIRLLPVSADGQSALMEALLHHANTLAGLDHPGILRVLDAGVHEDQPFWVSEFVEGRSLRSLLRAERQLSVERAVAIGNQLALALEALHQRALVHGDVRPETIVIGRRGEIKLADTGLAVLLARLGLLPLEAMNERAPYLAPEQVLGTEPRPESDVYALGAVLYEALAGEPPFSGGGLLGTAAQRLVREPPPIRARRPDLDLAVDNALQRALTPHVPDRLTSATELRAALLDRELVLSGEATASLPQASEQFPRPRRRLLLERLALLAPAAATGMVIAIGFVFLTAALPSFTSILQFAQTPDLTGRPLSEAAQIAKAAGLEVTVERIMPSMNAARDIVISQVPQPGEQMPRASAVKLIVSLGIQAPDVRGMPHDEARAFLAREGWTVANIEWTGGGDNAAPGTVIEQRPAPGEILPDKGALTLVVAAGNYAEGAPVRASSGAQPQAAIDGQVETFWKAQGADDEWLEIDLGRPLTVGGLELVVYQEQEGPTIHELWATNQAGEYFPLDTLRGVTRDGQTLRVTISPPADNIVRLRIYTALSTGTVGWREVRVLR